MNSENVPQLARSVPVAITDYSTFSRETKPIVVGILGFDGVTALDLTGPLEALTLARTDEADGRACYAPRIISGSGKTFTAESGLVLKARGTLGSGPDFDTIFIPGGIGVRAGQTQRDIAEWLLTHFAQFKRIVAVGTGIYPLAKSGLLDGRRVTTHWRFGQEIARRFPKLRVDQSASFLKDGPFYTCGGGTAAVELTLALIEEDYGSQVALSVARELGMRLRPLGDHENTLDPSQFECGPTDRLAELPTWIAAHLNDNLSVDVLAGRACLCPRHFGRLFKRVFRSTPANFVETLRIDEARRQLLLTRKSVESVAAAVGFTSCDSFRRAFERRLAINPTTFRKLRFAVVGNQSKRQTSNGAPSHFETVMRKSETGGKSLHALKSTRLVRA
jgi:transcriptional regulator GlxA family with amidase domain